MILAVTAQQAEVIRYGQTMANPLITLSLVLRSPDDFIDPVTGEPVPPVIAETSGITLQELIDTFGVLPPTIATPVVPELAAVIDAHPDDGLAQLTAAARRPPSQRITRTQPERDGRSDPCPRR